MDSKSIIPIPGSTLPAGKQFVGFSLDASTANYQLMLLPDEHELIVNTQSGHYVVVNWDVRYCVTDGIFQGAELRLTLALLNAWPSYVPLQKLIHIVFESFEEHFERDLAAMEDLVRGCNAHLRIANIAIETVNNQGYKLSRLEKAGQA